MRRSKKPTHRLESVRNCFFSETEQRLGSAELAEEPEEESELRPGLRQTAKPVKPIDLPKDIWTHQLVSYLTCGELNAFMSTNHFFAHNDALKEIRLNAERPFKMTAGKYSMLQFDAFGPVIENSIECPIKLAPGEWIIEAVAETDYSLLLTNRRLLMKGKCSFIPLRHQRALNREEFNECCIDLEPDERIIKIAAASTSCVLLSSAKQVLVCGDNQYGQLGLPDQKRQNGFKKLVLALLDNDEWVIDVAMNYSYTLLRTNRNRVLASGFNKFGRLGLSHWNHPDLFEPCSLAHVLHAEEGIKSVMAGGLYPVLLTTSNRMLVSGVSKWSQLGLGQSNQCSILFIECVIADLKPGESIERLATGHMHIIVLTNYYRLFISGTNHSEYESLDPYRFRECSIECLRDKEVIIDVRTGQGETLLITNQKRILASDTGLVLDHPGVSTFQDSDIPTHYRPSRPLEPESKEEEPVRVSRKRKTSAS